MAELIPISAPTITSIEESYVLAALKSGYVSSIGEYIEKFETAFAAFCGVPHAVAASNGTTALHLALAAMGIGPGDEVVVPDLTFIATANAVHYTGATPVLVDCDEETLCMSPESLKKAIGPKTKAVMPVHLYGHPADMTAINAIAKAHGLLVIEDAAEAHGAECRGARVGSLGDCGVFSFYGNKIVTTGEGGMITTRDKALYERMRFLRDHAMSKERRYWHPEIGFNYRMTNLQAALGAAQMERIDTIIAKKAAIYERYAKGLAGVPGLRLNRTAPWAKNVYWMVCMEYESFDETSRAAFMKRLKDRGVDSRPYFYPLSDMPPYAGRASTPTTHRLYKQGLNLPSFFDLPLEAVDGICAVVRETLREAE